jgi:hypothetical protein
MFYLFLNYVATVASPSHLSAVSLQCQVREASIDRGSPTGAGRPHMLAGGHSRPYVGGQVREAGHIGAARDENENDNF